MYIYMCMYISVVREFGSFFVLSGFCVSLLNIRELQRLGALEAAAKASNKGKWNKDTTKVSFLCTSSTYMYHVAGNFGEH